MNQNANQLMNPTYPNSNLVHPIHGNIKCLLAISWIALIFQTTYLSFTNSLNLYYSYLEVIFNILLTLSLISIAVLLSIANNLNSKKIYKMFKLSFIMSLVNFGVSILSISVILCALNNKLRGFLATSPSVEAFYSLQKYLFGGIVFFIRFMEFLPFLIFLCYIKPILNKNKGTINEHLEKPEGITDEKYNPLFKDNDMKKV
jgi:hypothetical protein